MAANSQQLQDIKLKIFSRFSWALSAKPHSLHTRLPRGIDMKKWLTLRRSKDLGGPPPIPEPDFGPSAGHTIESTQGTHHDSSSPYAPQTITSAAPTDDVVDPLPRAVVTSKGSMRGMPVEPLPSKRPMSSAKDYVEPWLDEHGNPTEMPASAPASNSNHSSSSSIPRPRNSQSSNEGISAVVDTIPTNHDRNLRAASFSHASARDRASTASSESELTARVHVPTPVEATTQQYAVSTTNRKSASKVPPLGPLGMEPLRDSDAPVIVTSKPRSAVVSPTNSEHGDGPVHTAPSTPKSGTRTPEEAPSLANRSRPESRRSSTKSRHSNDTGIDVLSCFYGKCDRIMAETLLHLRDNGTFLLREGSDGLTVSFTAAGTIRHMRITRDAEGKYILGGRAPSFKTIFEMLDYYALVALQVNSSEVFVKLERPLPRPERQLHILM